MTRRQLAGALTLTISWFGVTVSTFAQTRPPFVPEFKLLCHPTEPVREAPPDDPSADRFGNGPWYVNDGRSLWAAWQPLVSGPAGNRMLWIKPPGRKIEIVGRRLDGEAPALDVERNAAYLSKGFEPNRVYFPVAGCWEVTATSGKEELVFVVEVKAP